MVRRLPFSIKSSFPPENKFCKTKIAEEQAESSLKQEQDSVVKKRIIMK